MKKLWVAVTAHNPLMRLDPLLNVLSNYEKFPHEVKITIYIDYNSQNQVELLESIFETFKKINIIVKVAEPVYENWYLTWAHKLDLATAILNREADYYIYQENDMLLTISNFNYFQKWKPVLAKRNLEPGFFRYENFAGKKIPFDNHKIHSLTKETPNIWTDVGFKVPVFLVMDREIDFFVQLPNAYYAAMILTQEDGLKYIKSKSYDPGLSYSRVVLQNWPLADRSSMGLGFENVPDGLMHRRCIPVAKEGDKYIPHSCGMICHDDQKYSKTFVENNIKLLNFDEILTLG